MRADTWTKITAELCPRHPTKLTAPGWMVCTRCGDQLADALAWMADHWDHLGEMHTATTPRSGGRSVPASRPVANLLVVDAVDPHARADVPIAVIIQTWARAVGEDRDMLAQVPRLIPQQARWLLGHVDWLCAQSCAEDAVGELCDTRWRMAALIGDHGPGRTWPCACGGLMRAWSWLDLGRNDGPPAAICPSCGTTWDADTLRTWVIDGDADVWVDAVAAARLADVHEGTVRRWARQQAVRAESGLVELGDVLRRAAG